MALVLTFKTEPNSSGDRLWITDRTGQYDAVANPEGWGDPPPGNNHDLNASGLAVLILRKDSAGDQRLLAVSSDALFNPGAANDFENVFEFYFVNDGTHDMYMWRLPVSADGITDLETNSLIEGDYFYHSINQDVERVTATIPEIITDYTEMIDYPQTNLYQTLCQDIFSPRSAIKRQQEYRDYQAARQGNCAENPLFLKSMETTLDIISGEYSFRSGLLMEAQRQVETLLDDKDIDNANSPVSNPTP
jgi:hypothetical protein